MSLLLFFKQSRFAANIFPLMLEFLYGFVISFYVSIDLLTFVQREIEINIVLCSASQSKDGSWPSDGGSQ